VTPEQHIPNRGSRYAQQQQRRRSSNGYGGLSSDSSSNSNAGDDEHAAAAVADITSPRPQPPRDAIGESGHSTDTINA
jgi:hypothetical protein